MAPVGQLKSAGPLRPQLACFVLAVAFVERYHEGRRVLLQGYGQQLPEQGPQCVFRVLQRTGSFQYER